MKEKITMLLDERSLKNIQRDSDKCIEIFLECIRVSSREGLLAIKNRADAEAVVFLFMLTQSENNKMNFPLLSCVYQNCFYDLVDLLLEATYNAKAENGALTSKELKEMGLVE